MQTLKPSTSLIRRTLIFLTTAICLVLAGSILAEDDMSVEYENDGGFPESPPRSEQAKHALELDGERAVTLYFQFPHDTKDEPLAIYGIDVSHHNGKIDWSTIPDSNVVFAVAKATEGTGWFDPQFKQHWTELGSHRDESIVILFPVRDLFRGGVYEGEALPGGSSRPRSRSYVGR